MSAKVALIVTLPVALVISLFSYYSYLQGKSILFRDTEMQLLRVAEGLKGPAETHLRRGDLAGLQSLVLESAKGADIELIALFAPGEKVIASNKGKWIGRPVSSMYPEDLTDVDLAAIHKGFAGGYSMYNDPGDGQYCFVMPVEYGDSAVGVMHISMDMSTFASEVEKNAVTTLIAALIASALIGTSLYFLFRMLFTKRIRAVSAAAVGLAGGDMKARAEVAGTDEIGYLAASFNVLAEEIVNWRTNLEEMASSRMNDLLVLYDVVSTIGRSLELDKMLPDVLDCVISNMGTTKGAIVLAGGEGASLSLAVQRGLSEESVRLIGQSGRGGLGDAILRNKAMRINGKDAGEAEAGLGLRGENILSAVVAPISAYGAVLGAIALYSVKRDRFTDEDEALVSTIGNQLSVAVLNARLYEKTLDLAQIDGLTGVANRRHLMERLKQEINRAARYHTPLSVIMLDLDKFKSFNDSYGHLKGDELLKIFSAGLKSIVRTTDLAGRYGGEEFCVVLPNTSVKGALVLSERVRKFAEEIKVRIGDGQEPVGRTVSIGVAEFHEGETMEDLLHAADTALYRAKAGGRNRVAGPE